MAGILKIVATPIGNLGDLSPRALEALKEADVILAESIAHSRKLLSALEVELKNKKILSLAQQEETKRVKIVLERLAQGDKVALISDAGTPVISDPGGRMVKSVVAEGFQVEVFPGPCAIIAALMGAGLICTRFAFLGFLTKKRKERETLIGNAISNGFSLVIYESPNRVEKTLGDLYQWCGKKRVVVARELTKKFETFHRGILGQPLEPAWLAKGEAVIVVENNTVTKSSNLEGDALDKFIAELAAKKEFLMKEKARKVADVSDLTTKQAYLLLLKAANNF